MRNLIKLLYRWKIKVMFYFGMGYSEVNGVITLAKDLAILLGFMVLIFKIHLGIITTLLIGFVSFLIFIAIGVVLKASGMKDYAIKLDNSVNPEIKLINKIADKLGINKDD